MKIDWKLVWEATKEPLRLLALGLVSYLTVYLTGLNTQWGFLLLGVLRFVDKFLHVLGKAKEEQGTKAKPVESLLTGGLVRF